MTNIANTEQYDAWNGESGQRWAADPDGRDRMLAPVASTLIAAAQLMPGEAVLDIGCGCGSTTLAAAYAVGPTGSAYGVDLSELMLDVARRRAQAAGITNLTLMQADAQVHDFDPGAIDVAISRFGTMFFADAEAAFTNIATALRSGGRLCMATWQPLAANDWLTIPGNELLRYGTLPDSYAGGPNMFAQSDPDTVTRVLDHAGYVDIALESVHLTLTLGVDAREATDHFAATSASRAVLETVPPEQRPAVLDAIRTVLAEYADDTGVHLGAAIWIVTATRSA